MSMMMMMTTVSINKIGTLSRRNDIERVLVV